MTNPGFHWQVPHKTPVLSPGEVHIWRASLEQPPRLVSRLAATLSRDEETRSKRFHFDRERNRFIIARGVLRTILGRYHDIAPQNIKFSYGKRGKPYLAEVSANKAIQFNLAHSHDLALYGFTLDRLIGIDLEKIHPMKDMAQIAERFFTSSESEKLEKFPENRKAEMFFQCWTGKEAYIKALGEGLGFPLDQVEVYLEPDATARLLKIGNDPEEADRWSMKTLTPAADYTAAVAVEGLGLRFTFWQWTI